MTFASPPLLGRLASALISVGLIACGESFSAGHGTDAGREPGTDADVGSSAGRGGGGGQATGDALSPHPGSGGGGARGDGGATGRDAGGRTDAGSTFDDAGTPGKPDSGTVPTVSKDGLLLWLRADTGITEAGGGIRIWADQSGRHTDAIQTASNLAPHLVIQDGKPGVEFDGVEDHLEFAPGFSNFTNGLSILIVVQPTSIDACQSFVEFSNGSEIDDISLGVYQEKILYEVVDPYTQATPILAGTPQQITVVHDADGKVTVRRNGGLAQKTEFALPAEITRDFAYLGKSLYGGCDTFGGRISEVLLYERAVTGRELLELEQTLRERWACCTD